MGDGIYRIKRAASSKPVILIILLLETGLYS